MRTSRFTDINTDIYGNDPKSLLSDPKEVWFRLNAILGDKVLRFNPYSVDDKTLLECVERARWLSWPALTQMVVIHFHDIRQVEWKCPYDAMFFHIGNDPSELHLSIKALTDKLTYIANLKQIHVTIGGLMLTNHKMAERMQGKDYFVSHSLPARTPDYKFRPAYQLHRLKGNDSQLAEIVRKTMIEAKVAMLEEILAHPYCHHYLRCSRDFVDYTTPISEAIHTILHFPQTSALA